jgi:hypothetical protein
MTHEDRRVRPFEPRSAPRPYLKHHSLRSSNRLPMPRQLIRTFGGSITTLCIILNVRALPLVPGGVFRQGLTITAGRLVGPAKRVQRSDRTRCSR